MEVIWGHTEEDPGQSHSYSSRLSTHKTCHLPFLTPLAPVHSSRPERVCVVKMLGAVYLVSCIIAAQVPASHQQQEPCNNCTECAVTPSPLGFCNCDADCGVFGDCCNSQEPPASCTANLRGVTLAPVMECQSIFVDPSAEVLGPGEAYLMVTKCPNVAPVDTETISANCTSPGEALPPVTDTDSGLVYRNEYCARCHGATSLLAWQPSLGCRQEVYGLLENSSVASILLDRPDILTTECQACAYQVPPSPPPDVDTPRPCVPTVSSCLSQSELAEITEGVIEEGFYADLVESCSTAPLDPMSIITKSGMIVYRNRPCADCNNDAFGGEGLQCFAGLVNRSRIPNQCSPMLLPTNITSPPPSSVGGVDAYRIPFTITLSNLGGGQVLIATETAGEARVTVDCPEGQAPVGLDCRDTQCPEGYSETGGRCAFAMAPDGSLVADDREGDESSTAEGNTTEGTEREAFDGIPTPNSNTPLFLDCPTALLALNSSEFEARGNDTIFHDGELIKVLFYDGSGRPLICPDNTSLVLTNRTVTVLALLPGIGYLTYIGCSLSILGSGLILLTYGLFGELRTLPSLLLMNLSLVLLITDLLFIVGGPIVQNFPTANLCVAVAICIHFFTLVQFTWMSLFSIEMAYTIYLAKNLVRAEGRRKHRALLFYMLLGWGLPVVICVPAIALNYSGRGLVLYGVTSNGSVGSCWINHFPSFVLSFLVPLVASLLLNLALLVVVTALLCQSCRTKSRQQLTANYAFLVRVWLALFLTTGTTWVLGFLAIPDHTTFIWYPFVLFNSTQGIAIFLVFLCTKKILHLYVRLFTCKECSPDAEPNSPTVTKVIIAKEVRPMEMKPPPSLEAAGGPLNKAASESRETSLN